MGKHNRKKNQRGGKTPATTRNVVEASVEEPPHPTPQTGNQEIKESVAEEPLRISAASVEESEVVEENKNDDGRLKDRPTEIKTVISTTEECAKEDNASAAPMSSNGSVLTRSPRSGESVGGITSTAGGRAGGSSSSVRNDSDLTSLGYAASSFSQRTTPAPLLESPPPYPVDGVPEYAAGPLSQKEFLENVEEATTSMRKTGQTSSPGVKPDVQQKNPVMEETLSVLSPPAVPSSSSTSAPKSSTPMTRAQIIRAERASANTTPSGIAVGTPGNAVEVLKEGDPMGGAGSGEGGGAGGGGNGGGKKGNTWTITWTTSRLFPKNPLPSGAWFKEGAAAAFDRFSSMLQQTEVAKRWRAPYDAPPTPGPGGNGSESPSQSQGEGAESEEKMKGAKKKESPEPKGKPSPEEACGNTPKYVTQSRDGTPMRGSAGEYRHSRVRSDLSDLGPRGYGSGRRRGHGGSANNSANSSRNSSVFRSSVENTPNYRYQQQRTDRHGSAPRQTLFLQPEALQTRADPRQRGKGKGKGKNNSHPRGQNCKASDVFHPSAPRGSLNFMNIGEGDSRQDHSTKKKGPHHTQTRRDREMVESGYQQQQQEQQQHHQQGPAQFKSSLTDMAPILAAAAYSIIVESKGRNYRQQLLEKSAASSTAGGRTCFSPGNSSNNNNKVSHRRLRSADREEEFGSINGSSNSTQNTGLGVPGESMFLTNQSSRHGSPSGSPPAGTLLSIHQSTSSDPSGGALLASSSSRTPLAAAESTPGAHSSTRAFDSVDAPPMNLDSSISEAKLLDSFNTQAHQSSSGNHPNNARSRAGGANLTNTPPVVAIPAPRSVKEQRERNEKKGIEDELRSIILSLHEHVRFTEGSSAKIFAASMVYLRRIVSKNSRDENVVDEKNYRRLFAIAVMLATKLYVEEHVRVNVKFSKALDFPLEELNTLEIEFLHLIDFKLIVYDWDFLQTFEWIDDISIRRGLLQPSASSRSVSTTTSPYSPPLTGGGNYRHSSSRRSSVSLHTGRSTPQQSSSPAGHLVGGTASPMSPQTPVAVMLDTMGVIEPPGQLAARSAPQTPRVFQEPTPAILLGEPEQKRPGEAATAASSVSHSRSSSTVLQSSAVYVAGGGSSISSSSPYFGTDPKLWEESGEGEAPGTAAGRGTTPLNFIGFPAAATVDDTGSSPPACVGETLPHVEEIGGDYRTGLSSPFQHQNGDGEEGNLTYFSDSSAPNTPRLFSLKFLDPSPDVSEDEIGQEKKKEADTVPDTLPSLPSSSSDDECSFFKSRKKKKTQELTPQVDDEAEGKASLKKSEKKGRNKNNKPVHPPPTTFFEDESSGDDVGGGFFSRPKMQSRPDHHHYLPPGCESSEDSSEGSDDDDEGRTVGMLGRRSNVSGGGDSSDEGMRMKPMRMERSDLEESLVASRNTSTTVSNVGHKHHDPPHLKSGNSAISTREEDLTAPLFQLHHFGGVDNDYELTDDDEAVSSKRSARNTSGSRSLSKSKQSLVSAEPPPSSYSRPHSQWEDNGDSEEDVPQPRAMKMSRADACPF